MKNKTLTIAPVALVAITFIIGLVLSSTLTHADGNTDVVDELDVTVNSACTMKGGPNGTDDSGSSTYTTTINAGNYVELPGSKLVTLCNNPAGYAIYAIGFSGDSYVLQTHTDLIGTATTGNIPTGTSGDNSYWAMKLEAVEGLIPPSIVTDFQNYHVIPDTYTKVASYTTPTATASDAGATVQTKYKINISKTQLAGAYNGKVKYTMVYPNDAPAPTPTPPINPYCTDEATCMQNTSSGCDKTLTDGRDGATYTTATIAGSCWMTQNLRFQGTDLKVGESNVTSDITMTYGQLTSGQSYTEPKLATGTTTDYGTYYNYCAVSAGEVCNDTTSQDATRSVCPAGWKLPTQTQFPPTKDSHFTASSGIAGYYRGSSLFRAGTGVIWWASTAESATFQDGLLYYSDYGNWDTYSYYRYYGASVRCVRAS